MTCFKNRSSLLDRPRDFSDRLWRTVHEKCTNTYCGWLNVFSAGNRVEWPDSLRWCNRASLQSNDCKQNVQTFKWICQPHINHWSQYGEDDKLLLIPFLLKVGGWVSLSINTESLQLVSDLVRYTWGLSLPQRSTQKEWWQIYRGRPHQMLHTGLATHEQTTVWDYEQTVMSCNTMYTQIRQQHCKQSTFYIL